MAGFPGLADDEALVRGRRSLGEFELTFCSDGTYLLDGGAMFGVVPKTLWQKRALADELNRIQLGLNTTLHADGSVTPTFPNARYFAAAGELAHGRLQLERDRVSYLGPNYDPLIESGQLTLIDLDGVGGFVADDVRLRGPESLPPVGIQTAAEIVPGVWVEAFPGHTASMLGVHLESTSHGGASEHACYIADLIPTHHHLDPTWVMGYDLDPLTCIEQRKRFLKRAIAKKWLVLFTHDHQVPAAFLEWGEKGKPVVAG